jgi:hypothetical protein
MKIQLHALDALTPLRGSLIPNALGGTQSRFGLSGEELCCLCRVLNPESSAQFTEISWLHVRSLKQYYTSFKALGPLPSIWQSENFPCPLVDQLRDLTPRMMSLTPIYLSHGLHNNKSSYIPQDMLSWHTKSEGLNYVACVIEC